MCFFFSSETFLFFIFNKVLSCTKSNENATSFVQSLVINLETVKPHRSWSKRKCFGQIENFPRKQKLRIFRELCLAQPKLFAKLRIFRELCLAQPKLFAKL
jgi:hypothetical protein